MRLAFWQTSSHVYTKIEQQRNEMKWEKKISLNGWERRNQQTRTYTIYGIASTPSTPINCFWYNQNSIAEVSLIWFSYSSCFSICLFILFISFFFLFGSLFLHWIFVFSINDDREGHALSTESSLSARKCLSMNQNNNNNNRRKTLEN